MVGTADSCEAAAMALQVVGEIAISPRTVNQLGAEFGGQLAEERDRCRASAASRALCLARCRATLARSRLW